MKTLKYLLTFLLGAVVSLLFMYYIYFQYCKQNWLEQGRHDGAIDARFEIYNTIEKRFSKLKDEKVLDTLFIVKDADIVIVEQNGTRTIRTRR